jgi:hypothetical protein
MSGEYGGRKRTARGAFGAVGGGAGVKGEEVGVGAGHVGGAEGAADAAEVAVELDRADVLGLELALALARA